MLLKEFGGLAGAVSTLGLCIFLLTLTGCVVSNKPPHNTSSKNSRGSSSGSANTMAVMVAPDDVNIRYIGRVSLSHNVK